MEGKGKIFLMNDESYFILPLFIRPTVTTDPTILTKWAIKRCIRETSLPDLT